MIRLGLLAVLVVLVACGPASAATVSVYQSPGGGPSSIDVVDGKGERNDIAIEPTDAELIVRDAGAPLEAGEGCRLEPDASVRCPPTDTTTGLLSVRAGDGDDRVRTPFGVVDGEGGDDDLTGRSIAGGPGSDILRGDDGYNYLDGGPGSDVVEGGDGDDLFVDDDGPTPAADRLDAGAGVDELSFGARTTPVRIDLGSVPQEDTSPAGANTLDGFERVIGGAGDDEITGSRKANWIKGGPGDDRLSGGAGGDTLQGQGGDDILRGDDGADEVNGGRGEDDVSGGSWTDTLAGGPGRDSVKGGAGDDDVSGGRGRDRIRGGGGQDLVRARDRTPEDIDCGRGTDGLLGDRGERARRCERRGDAALDLVVVE